VSKKWHCRDLNLQPVDAETITLTAHPLRRTMVPTLALQNCDRWYERPSFNYCSLSFISVNVEESTARSPHDATYNEVHLPPEATGKCSKRLQVCVCFVHHHLMILYIYIYKQIQLWVCWFVFMVCNNVLMVCINPVLDWTMKLTSKSGF